MAEITREFATQVLSELVARGNSQDAIQERLASLSAEEQKVFIAQAAEKLGMSPAPVVDRRNFTPDVPPEPNVSSIAAAGRGAAQTASLGLAPKAAGVGSAIAEGVELTKEKFTGAPAGRPGTAGERLQQAFQTGAGAQKAELSEAEREQPLATSVGKGVGLGTVGVALSPLLVSAPVATAVGVGALEGAAAAEGGVTEGLKGGAVGATIGATGGLITPAITGIASVGTALRNSAKNLSVRLLKLSDSSIKNLGIKKLDKLGQMLVDEKLTTSPAMLKTVAKKVEDKTNQIGQRVKQIYVEASDELTTMSPEQLKERILANLRTIPESALPASEAAAIRNHLANILKDEARPLSVTEVWEVAKKLEKAARAFEKPGSNLGPRANALRKAALEIRTELTERIAARNPAEAARLRELNSSFSILSEANHALKPQVPVAKFKGKASTGDFTSRVVNAATGGTPLRTSIIGAFDVAGRMLERGGALGRFDRVLRDARTRGASALASTHYVLSQTDPEYQQLVREELERGE